MSSITHTQSRLVNALLFEATKEGNVCKIKEYFDQGANVFARQGSETLLHVAADLTEEKVTRLILNHLKIMQQEREKEIKEKEEELKEKRQTIKDPISIDHYINAKETNCDTPLMRAAKLGHIETMRTLLEHGARVYPNNLKAVKDGPVKELLTDYASKFFNMPFQDQLKLAIDNEDPKLVQLILGPRFSQLWQYFFAHAIIVYQMLTVEQKIHCDLPVEIITRQKELLSTSLQILQSRKRALEQNENMQRFTKEEEAFVNANQLISKLSIEASQIIEGYDKRYDITEEISFKSIEIAISQEHHPMIPEYTVHALRNVTSAIASNYTEDLHVYAQKVKEPLEKQIKQAMNVSTQVGNYANQANEHIQGATGQSIKQGLAQLPQNREVQAAELYFTAFEKAANIFTFLLNTVNDDLTKQSYVENRIAEIQKVTQALSSLKTEKETLKKALNTTKTQVKELIHAIKKDDTFFNKNFMNEMYKILLDNYLTILQNDTKKPLHKYINEDTIIEIKEKILDQAYNVDLNQISDTYGALEYAINKGEKANLDVISVLLTNLGHHQNLINLIDQSNSQNIRELRKESNNTIMIRAYDALFDFSHPSIDIFSMFPTHNGNFNKDEKETPILMKMGSEKYQDVLKNIEFVKQTLSEKMETWKHRTTRSFIYQWLYDLYDGELKKLEEKDFEEVLMQTTELMRRAVYADRFQDDGIMSDYLKTIKEKNKNQKLKKYSDHMHGIGSGTEIVGWVEYFSRLWNEKKHPKWKEAMGSFTFEQFLADTVKITENLRMQNARVQAEKNRQLEETSAIDREQAALGAQAAKEAKEEKALEVQARKQAEEKAALETQAAKEAKEEKALEAQARKQAEEKAALEAQARKQAEEKAALDRETKKQAEEKAALEAQARKQAEEKAALDRETKKQAEEKAALEAQARRALEEKFKKHLLKICFEKLKELDDELKDAINDEIKEAIIQVAMDYDEDVIDPIIEQMKSNKKKIMQERRLSPDLIEKALTTFLNQQICASSA